MSDENTPTLITKNERFLTTAEFNTLTAVPPEVEWFANLANPNTRRAYQNDLRHFQRFVGIPGPRNSAPSPAPMSLPGAKNWNNWPCPRPPPGFTTNGIRDRRTARRLEWNIDENRV